MRAVLVLVVALVAAFRHDAEKTLLRAAHNVVKKQHGEKHQSEAAHRIAPVVVGAPHENATDHPVVPAAQHETVGAEHAAVPAGHHDTVDAHKAEETLASEGLKTVNKWVLVVLSCFPFGMLGLDRLYAGSLTLCLCKLFTLGGFGIWAFVDNMYLLIVGLQQNKMAATDLGFAVQFREEETSTAFWLSLVMVLWAVTSCCLSLCNAGSQIQ
mmetsp:Transcript_28873/g.63590  ORF Transcript_28873/g.63590 Transcript_28873/m.63590 type:complete len:212 (-) Transcript_28873:60-695(-)